jgi:hypothetical protein
VPLEAIHSCFKNNVFVEFSGPSHSLLVLVNQRYSILYRSIQNYSLCGYTAFDVGVPYPDHRLREARRTLFVRPNDTAELIDVANVACDYDVAKPECSFDVIGPMP